MSVDARPMRHTLRILQLMRFLESARRPHSWYELAEYFGVCVRSIRRDVVLLQRLGAHVPIRVPDAAGAKAQVGPLTWQ